MTDLHQSFYESLSALSDDEISEIEVARVLRSLESQGPSEADTSEFDTDRDREETPMNQPHDGQTQERQLVREKLAQYYAIKDELQGTPLFVQPGSTSFADSVMRGIDSGLYDADDADLESTLTSAAISEIEKPASMQAASGTATVSQKVAAEQLAANDPAWYKRFMGQSVIAASVALVAVFGFQQFSSGPLPASNGGEAFVVDTQRIDEVASSPSQQNRAVVPEGYEAPNLIANTVAGGAPASKALSVDELVYSLQRNQLQNRELRERLQALSLENQRLKQMIAASKSSIKN